MQLLNDRADLPSESNRAGSPDPQSKPVSQTNTEPQLLLLEAVAEDGFHAGHIDEVARFIKQSGGRVVESRSTSDGSLTYIVLRSDDEPSAIAYALGVRAIPFRSVEPVRLVGAEVDAIQDDGVPRYLVEWDLPDGPRSSHLPGRQGRQDITLCAGSRGDVPANVRARGHGQMSLLLRRDMRRRRPLLRVRSSTHPWIASMS